MSDELVGTGIQHAPGIFGISDRNTSETETQCSTTSSTIAVVKQTAKSAYISKQSRKKKVGRTSSLAVSSTGSLMNTTLMNVEYC
jgi:hypothetical protein